MSLALALVLTCTFLTTTADRPTQERTSLLLKNNNGQWMTAKLGSRHDVAQTADNLRADPHPSTAPNDLQYGPDEHTRRSIEPTELRNGKSSATWSRYSSPTRRSTRANP